MTCHIPTGEHNYTNEGWAKKYDFRRRLNEDREGEDWIDSIYVPRCQHDDGYVDGRSQIKVHTDERA